MFAVLVVYVGVRPKEVELMTFQQPNTGPKVERVVVPVPATPVCLLASRAPVCSLVPDWYTELVWLLRVNQLILHLSKANGTELRLSHARVG